MTAEAVDEEFTVGLEVTSSTRSHITESGESAGVEIPRHSERSCVYIALAGGGILVQVDDNHLIDFASGIAVTPVGNSAFRVVERVQQQVADFNPRMRWSRPT